MVVAFRDVSADREAQHEFQAVHERVRLAVEEANHRFKNNLQVVAALLEMQAASDTEPLQSSAARRLAIHVRALADIHDMLATSASTDRPDWVSTTAALAKLVPMLQATVTPRLVQFTGDKLRLPADMTSSLVLIANELVSNAFKHGQGNVRVELCTEKGRGYLQVDDSGAGFPPGFDPEKAAQMGLELVERLAKSDLRGTVTYESSPEGGGRVKVSFPLPPASSD